jgi:uncharacterized membrane protein
MQKTKSIFRTNVVYGLIVLFPLAIIVLLLAKMVEIMELIAAPLNLDSYTSVALVIVLSIILLFVFCFAVGAILRTRLGALSFERFELTVLKQIPGYKIISNVLKGFAEKKTAYPGALVRLFGSETAVFGFVMEEHDNGLVTVFVPSAPVLTVGTVYVVKREQLTILDAGAIAVTECISQWGIGSQKILGGVQT